MNVFQELKRRNVYRVATAYIIVGWLIMQVVDVMVPALKMPDWVASLFAVVLMIGFPIVLVLSWVYDITPDGVIRTDPADAGSEPGGAASRRLDMLIIGGLILVAGLIVWQQLDLRGETAPGGADVKAIAVLPFDDLSPDGSFQYFADGISEEILNALSRQSRLAVMGRTSSFSFRASPQTVSEIGAKLGVGALLEGSVRKYEDQVRIDARLVRTRDGVMLWSETYESRLGDIFDMQDDIARQVRLALRQQLQRAGATDPARGDVDAYDRYLRARELIRTRSPQAVETARDLLESALADDPEYALLLAALAQVERLLSNAPGGVGSAALSEAVPRATEYAERALQLAPELADAHAIRGLLHFDTNDLLLAERSLRRALEINPRHVDARLWLSLCHTANRRYRDGFDDLAEVFSVDPLFQPATYNFVNAALDTGNSDRARSVLERLRLLDAEPAFLEQTTALYLGGKGQIAEAVRALDAVWARGNAQTTVGAQATFARLRIGDSEGALAYGLPFAPIRAALLGGRDDEAVALMTAWMDAAGDLYFTRAELVRTLAAAREDERLIDYYRDNYASLERFERAFYWPFDAEVPPFYALAYAAHRAGDTVLLEEVLDRWRRVVDVGRTNGADNVNYDVSDARWHGLAGNPEAAIMHLRRAAAKGDGLIGADLPGEYLATLLAEQDGFAELLERNAARIADERASLGLPALTENPGIAEP